jgi:hypothetical protein
VVAAVADALAGRGGRTAGAFAHEAHSAAASVAREDTAADADIADTAPPPDPELSRAAQAPPLPVMAPIPEHTAADVAPGDGREATRHGGLLFLAWPIGEVVVPVVAPATLPATITRLCLQLARADADDPAVRALAGPLPDGEPPPGEPDPERDDAVERRVRAWLGARLRSGAAEHDRPDELDWLWRRPALIETTPGWIEAEFSLADVDVRIRQALLDVDPGWLWWRGAVMRFRYV